MKSLLENLVFSFFLLTLKIPSFKFDMKVIPWLKAALLLHSSFLVKVTISQYFSYIGWSQKLTGSPLFNVLLQVCLSVNERSQDR